MAKKKTNKNFEEKLNRLEEITDNLEKEGVGIDESVSLFEEGILLSKECLTSLKDAELKIIELKNKIKDVTDNDIDSFNENEIDGE